jgi:hypothetical protein
MRWQQDVELKSAASIPAVLYLPLQARGGTQFCQRTRTQILGRTHILPPAFGIGMIQIDPLDSRFDTCNVIL